MPGAHIERAAKPWTYKQKFPDLREPSLLEELECEAHIVIIDPGDRPSAQLEVLPSGGTDLLVGIGILRLISLGNEIAKGNPNVAACIVQPDAHCPESCHRL